MKKHMLSKLYLTYNIGYNCRNFKAEPKQRLCAATVSHGMCFVSKPSILLCELLVEAWLFRLESWAFEPETFAPGLKTNNAASAGGHVQWT